MRWICAKEWKEWQKDLEKKEKQEVKVNIKAEGIIEGKLEEKQNMLKEQLGIKFGSLFK